MLWMFKMPRAVNGQVGLSTPSGGETEAIMPKRHLPSKNGNRRVTTLHMQVAAMQLGMPKRQ